MDYFIGYIFQKLSFSLKSGTIGRENYMCNKDSSEILIFGSSTAARHYNPKIFVDSLNMSCYNFGEPGNGIICSYGRLLLRLERKKPKLIILDLNLKYDLEENDNTKYLGPLKRFYHREGIFDIFKMVDEKECFLMNSYLYSYNSRFINYFKQILSQTEISVHGYLPLKGNFDSLRIRKRSYIEKSKDNVKQKLMEDFISRTKGIPLIFVISPTWYNRSEEELNKLREMGNIYNKALIDFSDSTKYVHNDYFFWDGIHLNSKGADEFTKDFIFLLKERLSISTVDCYK